MSVFMFRGTIVSRNFTMPHCRVTQIYFLAFGQPEYLHRTKATSKVPNNLLGKVRLVSIALCFGTMAHIPNEKKKESIRRI